MVDFSSEKDNSLTREALILREIERDKNLQLLTFFTTWVGSANHLKEETQRKLLNRIIKEYTACLFPWLAPELGKSNDEGTLVSEEEGKQLIELYYNMTGADREKHGG